jgi:UDP-GlcNAc3NAcA epimerase
MIKLISIIGARPQIIKAAALSRAIRNNFSNDIEDIIVHTGQHYDNALSKVFFDELDIQAPMINFNSGSGSHAEQTADILIKTEKLLLEEKPDYVVVYGDTNSTLAASLAAIKIQTPIIHIEAGLRSFNKRMPEEVNRIVCDHASTLLFTPTRTGLNNLIAEGFNLHRSAPFSADQPGVFHCGDIMYDNSLYFSAIAEDKSKILESLKIEKDHFLLATIHRDINTDNPNRLSSIFKALIHIASEYQIRIVLPVHPRTSMAMEMNLETDFFELIQSHSRIEIIPPASFLDIIQLEKNCKLLITDSGGVQKEAYFFKKPSIILRAETEWSEIIENKTAILADANTERIINAYEKLINAELDFPSVFGDGHAAEFICREILKCN